MKSRKEQKAKEKSTEKKKKDRSEKGSAYTLSHRASPDEVELEAELPSRMTAKAHSTRKEKKEKKKMKLQR